MNQKTPSVIFSFLILFISQYGWAQWTSTNGPYDVVINAVALTDDQIYAGTDGVGLLYSNDNGYSWTRVSENIPGDVDVRDIAVGNSKIFALTDEGFYESTDNGETWNSVSLNLPEGRDKPYNISVKGSRILVGTSYIDNNSLKYSTDNGDTWTTLSGGLSANYAIFAIGFLGTNSILIGTDYGMYVSTNDGANFQAANNGFISSFPAISDIATNNSSAFAISSSKLYRSIDSGSNWNELIVDPSAPSPFYISTIVEDEGILYAGTNNGIYKSVDNGDNWSLISSGIPTADDTNIKSLEVKGSAIVAGTYRQIYYTENYNLSPLSPIGVPVNPFYPVFATDSIVYAGSVDQVKSNYSKRGVYFFDPNEGLGWENFNPNGYFYRKVTAIQPDDNKVFVGTEGMGVFVTSDNGATWENFNTGMSNNQVYSLTKKGNYLIAGTVDGFFYTQTDQPDWRSGFIYPEMPYLKVNSFHTSDNYIYAATDNGVYRSYSGDSWQEVGSMYSSVTSVISSGGYIFAGTYYGLYKYEGSNWNQVISTYDLSRINALAEVNGDIIVGSNNGAFISSDYGNSWDSFSEGLPSDSIIGSFSISGSKIYSTTGSGVYERDLLITGISTSYLRNLHVEINPNPSDGTFFIKAKHNISDDLTITVSDILGKPVSFTSGIVTDHNIRIELPDIEKGIYIVHLNTSNETESYRIVVK